MKLKLTERAIQGRSLATYVTLVVVVVGMGSYLWLAWREGPMFIFEAIGIALAVDQVRYRLLIGAN